MTSFSRIAASFAVSLLATFACAPSVCAQSLYSPIAVNIPFGFENGSHHLPPGRYTLRLTTDNMLFVRGNTDGTNFMVRDDSNATPSDHSKLVFRKLGDRYYLREIWLAGSETHSICNKTAAEKEQEIAINRVTPQAPQVAVLNLNH